MQTKKVREALCVLALGIATGVAHAVPLQADGSWTALAVDAFLADPARPLTWIDDAGSEITFTFTVAAASSATLTVLDAAFAGDTFSVFSGASLLGTTSAVPVGSLETSPNAGLDYAAALANPLFSRGVYTFGPGTYEISGRLEQSALSGGFALNATAGAVSLVVTPVPEPGTVALLGAGLAALGGVARRRGRRSNN
jgi:hypothetical protein